MENLKKHIGFITSWMQNEVSVEELEVQPMQIITNEIPTAQLTPAHTELKTRIKMTEIAMSGKLFAKMSDIKKKEFFEEYRWLISLDAQLGA